MSEGSGAVEEAPSDLPAAAGIWNSASVHLCLEACRPRVPGMDTPVSVLQVVGRRGAELRPLVHRQTVWWSQPSFGDHTVFVL